MYAYKSKYILKHTKKNGLTNDIGIFDADKYCWTSWKEGVTEGTSRFIYGKKKTLHQMGGY